MLTPRRILIRYQINWQLYSKLPPDVRTPRSTSETELNHPTEKTRFDHLCLRFLVKPHVDLTIHFTVTCSKDLSILEGLHLWHQLTPNPQGAIHQGFLIPAGVNSRQLWPSVC